MKTESHQLTTERLKETLSQAVAVVVAVLSDYSAAVLSKFSHSPHLATHEDPHSCEATLFVWKSSTIHHIGEKLYSYTVMTEHMAVHTGEMSLSMKNVLWRGSLGMTEICLYKMVAYVTGKTHDRLPLKVVIHFNTLVCQPVIVLSINSWPLIEFRW